MKLTRIRNAIIVWQRTGKTVQPKGLRGLWTRWLVWNRVGRGKHFVS
jgi:hypothetical protein